MPATKSQRPVVSRARAPRPRLHSVARDDSTATSDSETDDSQLSEAIDIRRSRTDYYSKTPEDRERTARPMMQERTRRKGDLERVAPRPRASSSTLHLVGKSSHVSHRRRRRKDDEDGAEYVYKQTVTKSKASTPARTKTQRSSVSVNERKSSGTERTVLDRLGLGSPQRRQSTRSIARASDEPLQQRQSHNTGVKRRDSVRSIDRPPQSSPKRVSSVRQSSTTSDTKPLSRSNTTQTRRTRRTTQVLAAVPEESKAQTSARPKSGVFGALFAPAKASASESRVTCLTCLSEDIPISRTAKLGCGHRMCHPCLKRIFTLSVTDPAHMPPKCCTQDCIPLKHVDKIFDTKFKAKWNRKYQEYTTKNRIYCPSRGCGAWIPPKDIRPDPRNPRRKYGKCMRCKTQVCATCNNKLHKSAECPKDEETQRFSEMAKEKGWQRCYNCRATVELKEGCNHMTCRCTAQFCMICGAKWKSCDCPWFNYAAVETDRLNHMNVAEFRREPIDPNGTMPPRAYREELERRRAQEQEDEELARRMQDVDIDLVGRRATRRRMADNDPAAGLGGGWYFPGLGNTVQGLTDDFIQRAQNILTGPYNQEQRTAADQLVAEMRDRQRTADLGQDVPARRATVSGRRASAPISGPGTAGVPSSRSRETEVLVRRRSPEDYEAPPARVRPRASVRKTPTKARAASGSDIAGRSRGESSSDSPVRTATLAGLTRKSTQSRVDAWRRHVDPASGPE